MNNFFSHANNKKEKGCKDPNEVLKTKKEADEAHKQYISNIKEKKKISEKISKHRKITRRAGVARKELSKKEQATKALKRTKDGKKITFDDFKSLIDRGLI